MEKEMEREIKMEREREMELIIHQLHLAIHRFYSNFKLRRCNSPNPNLFILNNLSKIKIIKIYCKKCIYSKDSNQIKDNIVIVFKLSVFKRENINLNLLFEDYKDIIKDYKDVVFT